MALRPNNHVTGDSAVRKIASDLIPEEWTISIPDSDYGLDMLIEVVRENKTTGKLFFIQSKGTTDSSSDGIITFSMNLERIKDYSDINLPVLFVYYSKPDGLFWGRWMNSLYNTLTEEQKRQRTISLRFTTENVIDTTYLRSIGNDIIPTIPNCVSLVCDNIPELFSRFHSQVVSTAKRLIGSDITRDARLSCKTIYLSYKGTLREGTVKIRNDNVSVSIPIQLASSEVLYYNPLAREECPPCFLEIIYAIALYSSGISSQSFDYALAHPQIEAFEYISDNIWQELLDHVCVKDVDNLHSLFDFSIKTKHDDIAQYILLVVFLLALNNPEIVDSYHYFLSSYLNSVQDQNSKGLLCYNLANSLRQRDCYEAFGLYFKALHYNPLYRELCYWWEEVGGILYLTNHFYFAELFYKKARKLSPNECREDIGVLIADCQLCQGKIKEALSEESNYFETHKITSSRCHLKSLITDMMDQLGIQVFDSVYWFNHGVSFSREGKHRDSMNCFLVAWRLRDGDLEALTNAFIESYNSMDKLKMTLIIAVIRDLNPEEGYKKIVSTLVAGSLDNPNIGMSLDALKSLFFPKDSIISENT